MKSLESRLSVDTWTFQTGDVLVMREMTVHSVPAAVFPEFIAQYMLLAFSSCP